MSVHVDGGALWRDLMTFRRTRNAALGHDYAMAADDNVVGNLHKIVDLGVPSPMVVSDNAPRSTVEFAPISIFIGELCGHRLHLA